MRKHDKHRLNLVPSCYFFPRLVKDFHLSALSTQHQHEQLQRNGEANAIISGRRRTLDKGLFF